MVQISQTEEDIKISIELNRLVTRKPDVVLLPQYLKFNNPPIFFERHLAQEIDEMASFCRIFKHEARIVLIKKQPGIWPELFQKLNREALMQKRLEIADLIVERNKKRDEMALERYENKRRTEIEKEVKREGDMKDRVKKFQEASCQEALMVGVRKETHAKPHSNSNNDIKSTNKQEKQQQSATDYRQATPVVRYQPPSAMSAVRGNGRINVSFSGQHKMETPKRESQAGIQMPFTIQDRLNGKPPTIEKTPMETLDE
ncbi:dynein axonemal assembly factor 4 [Drosophila grimshawi]|uniref:Dynein axonemal assembly factor 4 n=1 Tax=Drosophila grimshawi TaxID=7222 RepID=B4JBD8_DROGR|nr:dynein axonemal assembly factor 4 [Drosophila grimshawi]EDW02943.1 GH10968 [Drosophila grimshawi]